MNDGPKIDLSGSEGTTLTELLQDADVLGALRDHRDDQRAPGNSAPGETTGDIGTSRAG